MVIRTDEAGSLKSILNIWTTFQRVFFQEKEDKIYEGLTTQISEWWTEMFQGSALTVGQSFTIRFGSQVFKTMRVEELIKNRKVAWRVEDALIDLPELVNKKEWVNTRIIWDLSTSSNRTFLKMTHMDLTQRQSVTTYVRADGKAFFTASTSS